MCEYLCIYVYAKRCKSVSIENNIHAFLKQLYLPEQVERQWSRYIGMNTLAILLKRGCDIINDQEINLSQI